MSVAIQQLALMILQGLGVMAAVAVAFGRVRRARLHPWQRSLLVALTFGLGAAALASFPARVTPGIVIDGRFLLAAMAAAFGGPLALLAAVAAGGAVRLALGVPHVLFDLLGPLLAGCTALLWDWTVRRRHGVSATSLAVLGLMLAITIAFVPGGPDLGATDFPLRAWLVAALAVMVSVGIGGYLLRRELGMIERETQLATAALRDPLTGLHNRRSFDAELAAALLRPGPLMLLVIDVDHFKVINDRFGHGLGDTALRALAEALQASVRPGDVVGRLGGEEFGIVLAGLDAEAGGRMAARIRERVEGLALAADGVEVRLTVSIGGEMARAGDDMGRLMAAADRALYAAKQAGRNRVELGNAPSLPEPLSVRLSEFGPPPGTLLN